MNIIPFDSFIFVIGLAAGFVGSLIGIGGGLIVIPVLVLVLGVNIKYAMGAALVTLVATSSGSFSNYFKKGLCNINLGLFLSLATITGAFIGASIATRANGKVLSVIFGSILLVVIFFAIFKKNNPKPVDNEEVSALVSKLELSFDAKIDGVQKKYGVYNLFPGFMMMAVAGFFSGLLGIGAGVFKVIAMDNIMKLPFKVSTATSSFIIGITATASVGVYMSHGFIMPALVFPVAIGVFFGALTGSKISHLIPVSILRIVFFIIIAATGVQMILKGFGVSV